MAGNGYAVEERGGVLLVRLSRPDRLNALDSGLLDSLRGLLEERSREPMTLLIAAEGRVFSAGIDLSEVARASSPLEAARPFRALGGLLKALVSYPAPTLSYIHAPAIAGGAEIALATDLIIVGPGGRLEWPEVRWNIVAPLLVALAQRLGTSRLASAALLGERISSEEALRLGIAAYRAETLDEALALAGKVDKLYRDNTRAYARMLPLLRQWKFEALEEVLPELEGLASSMELVERARRFLEGKRG